MTAKNSLARQQCCAPSQTPSPVEPSPQQGNVSGPTALCFGDCRRSGESHDTEDVLYASLAAAVHFLFLHAEPADVLSKSPEPPAGEALTMHILHKLLLLCGIKRHHCQRFVNGIRAELLRLSFPSAAEVAAASLTCFPNGSPLHGDGATSLHPSPTSQTPSSPPDAAVTAAASARSRWLMGSAFGHSQHSTGSNRVAVVRRLWVDKATWAASQADPVTLEALLLAQVGAHGPDAEFVLCVAREAAEKVIARLFIEELRGQMMTVNPIPRWRMACRLLNGGEAPIIIFCGGTSGSGKSTLASLIAAQLSIGHVLSTDTVRQALRAQVAENVAPELFVSTYEAFKVARSAASRGAVAAASSAATAAAVGWPSDEEPTTEEVVAAFERQAALVLDALDKTLDSLIARGQSVVVEGVHLLPEYMARKQSEFWGRRVLCSSVLIQIRKEARHRERFAVRVKCMTLDPKGNKYVSHFPHIRTIQAYLNAQAERLPILNINNTNIDKSFMMVHYALLQLIEHVGMEGWPTNRMDAAIPLRTPVNVNAKKMLRYLQERRREGHPKATAPSRRTMASRVAFTNAFPSEQPDLLRRPAGAEATKLPSSCSHVDPPQGSSGGSPRPCALCRALQLLTTAVVTRAHSAEVLTAPQRRQFDSPPPQTFAPAEREDWVLAATVGTDAASAGSTNVSGGTATMCAGHADPPRRSNSYAHSFSARQSAQPLRQLGKCVSVDAEKEQASDTVNGGSAAPQQPAALPSDDEEDDTGSLVDEPR